jgi:hypothetical protein
MPIGTGEKEKDGSLGLWALFMNCFIPREGQEGKDRGDKWPRGVLILFSSTFCPETKSSLF